jgi:hypothetical protein
MAYDLYDFTESLSVAGVPEQRVEHCSFAFGEQGGYAEWEGGFVCHTRSGKPWIFVFGWCDTTGWGCQDGAWVVEFDTEPSVEQIVGEWRKQMHGEPPITLADRDPIDLNRHLRGEASDAA